MYHTYHDGLASHGLLGLTGSVGPDGDGFAWIVGLDVDGFAWIVWLDRDCRD